MRSVHVIVRGRVQGVGFRWFTRDAAETAGIAGWVRNRRDGTVEAELHGDDQAVSTVLNRLSEGPEWSNVDDLAVTDAEPAPLYAGFDIRPTV
ncbi:acylphosphatase [Microbacterium pseudoresistens]